MKFGFIAKHRGIWPLSWVCQTLGVTRGGFYLWLKRPQSTRACADAKLSTAIHDSFQQSERTYGARRVHRDLRHWGHRCGLHRVERLMRRERLIARPRRRCMPFDVGPRSEHSIAPNVLNR